MPDAVRVLDAAGCEVILVEAVGAGQLQLGITGVADTTVVVIAPGFGDRFQTAKAGPREAGDVYVINKGDQDGHLQAVRLMASMLTAVQRARSWQPPVLATVATVGEGVEPLARAVADHRAWMTEHGLLLPLRRWRAAAEVERLVTCRLRARIAPSPGGSRLEALAEQVTAGGSLQGSGRTARVLYRTVAGHDRRQAE